MYMYMQSITAALNQILERMLHVHVCSENKAFDQQYYTEFIGVVIMVIYN